MKHLLIVAILIVPILASGQSTGERLLTLIDEYEAGEVELNVDRVPLGYGDIVEYVGDMKSTLMISVTGIDKKVYPFIVRDFEDRYGTARKSKMVDYGLTYIFSEETVYNWGALTYVATWSRINSPIYERISIHYDNESLTLHLRKDDQPQAHSN